jgi:hypothetical protein
MPRATFPINENMEDANTVDPKYNSGKSVVHVRPKKPKSAYVLYMESSKANYFLNFPDSSFNDFQKHAGNLWRTMSEDERKVMTSRGAKIWS